MQSTFALSETVADLATNDLIRRFQTASIGSGRGCQEWWPRFPAASKNIQAVDSLLTCPSVSPEQPINAVARGPAVACAQFVILTHLQRPVAWYAAAFDIAQRADTSVLPPRRPV
jgi:hypothetical protein